MSSRAEQGSSFLHRASPVVAVLAALAGVWSAVLGDTTWAVLFLAGAALVALTHRRRRAAEPAARASAAAAAEWHPARVRELAARRGVDLQTRRVAVVKAVRTEDRRLLLRDAVAVVDAATRDRPVG